MNSSGPTDFKVSIERVGDAAIVGVAGELDMAVVDDFAAALKPESVEGAEVVVVDMTETSFMDSSGLRTLLVSGDGLGDNGKRWALAVGEDSPVRRMLALAEVEERLPLYASRKEALSAVAEGTS